jgi:predicted RNA-binding protein with PUA-like domain
MVTVRRQSAARVGDKAYFFCGQMDLPEIVCLTSVVAFCMKNAYLDELLQTCGLRKRKAEPINVKKM